MTMMWYLVLISFIFNTFLLYPITSNHETTASLSDNDVIYTCADGKPCFINCYACQRSTLNCPSNSNCYVFCRSENSCNNTIINGPSNSTNNHCGTTLNISLLGRYAGWNMEINGEDTDYVSIIAEGEYGLYNSEIRNNRGKQLNIISPYGDAGSISNATFTGPNNGVININIDDNYWSCDGEKSASFYNSIIYANSADNVSVNCGYCGCRKMDLRGGTIQNKLDVYASNEYGIRDSDIYCPDDGVEDEYPTPNGTQSCKFRANKDYGSSIYNTRVYAVEGMVFLKKALFLFFLLGSKISTIYIMFQVQEKFF